MIELDVQNPYGYTTIPQEDDLTKWVEAAIQGNSKHDFSVVIRFVNEEEGKTLNHAYRQKKYATNVLSFPFEEPQFTTDIIELSDALTQHLEHQHFGDIVLCEAVVRREAHQQEKQLQHHWAHLVVHGVLHLQGYDHLDDKEAALMESLEVKILATLGFKNPY